MINFSDSTPTAPSGRINVKWQGDSSGNVSASIPTPIDEIAQSANTVLAGPATGIASDPTFRALAPGDLPALSSAQLATLLTDETGSGAAVFATSPTLVTPALGTPASGTLTNCTGLPESGVVNLATDLAAKAPLASPAFTGTPTAPTPSTSDNSTTLATTAYVQAQGFGTGSGSVSSVGLTVPSWLSVSGTPVTSSGTLAVSPTSGQTANQFLATPNGTTGAVGLRTIVQADLPAQPVKIPCSIAGKPGASALVLIFTETDAISFAANFSGSYGTVGTNPTATASYNVLKNGTSIGGVSISTSGVFTFTTSGGATESLAAGDRLTVTAPSPQDTTLADVAFTLRATR